MKRNKNDMADAEAICEAVNRLTMRFVAIKTPDQQSVLVLADQRYVRDRRHSGSGNWVGGESLRCPVPSVFMIHMS